MAWRDLMLETLEARSMDENDRSLDCRGSNIAAVMIVLFGLFGAVLWGLAMLRIGLALIGGA